jgi:hypothetical protein
MSYNFCEINLCDGIIQFSTDEVVLELYYNHDMLLRSRNCDNCGQIFVKSRKKTRLIPIRGDREYSQEKCNFQNRSMTKLGRLVHTILCKEISVFDALASNTAFKGGFDYQQCYLF